MKIHTLPCSSGSALLNYDETIVTPEGEKKPVLGKKLLNYWTEQDKADFPISSQDKFAVWGVTDGKRNINKNKWLKMAAGDLVLFYGGYEFFSVGKVIYKTTNSSLASHLWDTSKLNSDEKMDWLNIFLIDEIRDTRIPLKNFNKIMGYAPNYIVQAYQVYDELISERIIEGLDLGDWDSPIYYDKRKSLQERLSNLVQTDSVSNATRRLEQSILREHLFGNSSTSHTCAICLKDYPDSLLHAAHIKKRQNCSEEERKNLNIVMPLCKLGCDEMFEKGFILVNAEGLVEVNQDKVTTSDLEMYLLQVKDNACSHFNNDTKQFFLHRYRVNNRR